MPRDDEAYARIREFQQRDLAASVQNTKNEIERLLTRSKAVINSKVSTTQQIRERVREYMSDTYGKDIDCIPRTDPSGEVVWHLVGVGLPDEGEDDDELLEQVKDAITMASAEVSKPQVEGPVLEIESDA